MKYNLPWRRLWKLLVILFRAVTRTYVFFSLEWTEKQFSPLHHSFLRRVHLFAGKYDTSLCQALR